MPLLQAPLPCAAIRTALPGLLAGLFYSIPVSASRPAAVFCRSGCWVSLILPPDRVCVSGTNSQMCAHG
jgi:hypothetical protein